LEKLIGDSNKPLTVGELMTELSLRFERFKIQSKKNEENEELEDYDCSAVS
jgi:hypothetical protein